MQTHKKPHKTRMREAFFGRRQGKPLRENQIKRQDELLPQVLIDMTQPAPSSLKDLFNKPVDGVRLEIGFGGGEHLLHEASRFPNTGFIGVEPFVNGMAKLLSGLEERENLQSSLRLYNDDATALLDWLPQHSLDGIDLFYPDPWPKKKHWKRRFVSEKNLQRFARVLKKGALFRFASDIDTYINWTLLHCRNHGQFEWIANDASDWHTPYEAWPGTRYEAKAIREMRRPAYLTFLHV